MLKMTFYMTIASLLCSAATTVNANDAYRPSAPPLPEHNTHAPTNAPSAPPAYTPSAPPAHTRNDAHTTNDEHPSAPPAYTEHGEYAPSAPPTALLNGADGPPVYTDAAKESLEGTNHAIKCAHEEKQRIVDKITALKYEKETLENRRKREAKGSEEYLRLASQLNNVIRTLGNLGEQKREQERKIVQLQSHSQTVKRGLKKEQAKQARQQNPGFTLQDLLGKR